MNIFALDTDPKLAAQYQCDKHVVKMILETSQILMTNFHVAHGFEKKNQLTDVYLAETFTDFPRRKDDGSPHPYGFTHVNHPSTIWARESQDNFEWTLQLGLELCAEYTRRYNKVHKCEPILNWVKNQTVRFPDIGLTPVKLAMPNELRDPDNVANLLRLVDVELTGVAYVDAYRAYYIYFKTDIVRWAYSDKPFWFPEIQLIKIINERIELNPALHVSNPT